MKKALPIIRMKEIGPISMFRYDIDIDDKEWYQKTCQKARLEIPDEEVFNWWMNEALKETIQHIEDMNLFQHFCWKWKIRLLRLFKRI